MEIERLFDAERINAVLNHPVVRPDISEAPAGKIDISGGVSNTNNVLLMGEYGGCFLIRLFPGVYEVHTQALPEGRGRWIADFAAAGTSWMFTNTDAFEIVTRIPVKHRGALALAKMSGLKYEMTRPDECVWREERQDCEIHSMRIQDWAADAKEYEAPGREFHDFLHAEAARLGVTDPAHCDDPNHNQYVGICLAMMEAGQIHKAISFYNRWALLSRHPLISLESTNPLRVRIDLGTLVIENGTRRIERLKAAA